MFYFKAFNIKLYKIYINICLMWYLVTFLNLVKLIVHIIKQKHNYLLFDLYIN